MREFNLHCPKCKKHACISFDPDFLNEEAVAAAAPAIRRAMERSPSRQGFW